MVSVDYLGFLGPSGALRLRLLLYHVISKIPYLSPFTVLDLDLTRRHRGETRHYY